MYLYWTEYSGRKIDVTPNNNYVLYLYWTESSGRKMDVTHTQQRLYIVFVLDGIFRPENECNTHNNNNYVLYLYMTEYSGRKVEVNNKCVLCLNFRPESGSEH